MGRGDGIFIVDNTPTPLTPGVANTFHKEILDAILAGGVLPEELADLITLTSVVVDGKTRWVVGWA